MLRHESTCVITLAQDGYPGFAGWPCDCTPNEQCTGAPVGGSQDGVSTLPAADTFVMSREQWDGLLSGGVALLDTKPTNPKDQAATSRLDLSLFPQTAIAYGALAMTEGHLKYGGYNYRPGGVLGSIYVAAAMRHLFKYFNGQDEDPDTGVPELASALSCIAVLIDATECGVLNDDRPPKQDMFDLLNRMQDKVKSLQEKFARCPGRYTEKDNGRTD